MQHPTYGQNKAALERKLTRSAFRRGTNAFRFRLIPKGVSDHVPIQAKIKVFDTLQFSMMSWNLLADQHLFNNFVNISGANEIASALLRNPIEGGNVYVASKQSNKFADLFSELAEFLYKTRGDGEVVVDSKSLENFVPVKSQKSRLARSRDPEKIPKKVKQVEESRRAIVELLLDEAHDDMHDFRMAIRHSLELYYHIKDKDGALQWKNRFSVLESNKPLIKKMTHKDIVCLQECTEPMHISGLFEKAGKPMRVLTHRVNDRTNDHCVLMFDASKFELLGDPINTAFEGKKPCIFAKLRDKATGAVFVMASIHHPGGADKNLFAEMMEHVNRLRQGGHKSIPYFVAGDYNHTQPFFQADQKATESIVEAYPVLPTMAGSDYGHLNHAIDAVMSNVDKGGIQISRVEEVAISEPAQAPSFVVKFVSRASSTPKASASFFNPVRPSAEKPAAEILKPSRAKTGPVVSLTL